MSHPSTASRKRKIKLLKMCTSNSVEINIASKEGKAKIDILHAGSVKLRISPDELHRIIQDGLLKQTDLGWVTTSAGKMHLRRLLSEVDEFQAQHRLVGERQVNLDGQLSTCHKRGGITAFPPAV